jgi:carboxyl-terminal processing protease
MEGKSNMVKTKNSRDHTHTFMKLSTLRNYVIFLGLFVVVFGIGFQLGERHTLILPGNVSVVGTRPPNTTIDFSLFWTVWDKVTHTYYDPKAVEPAKMTNGAISGMVSSLGDPYTVFLPPDQNKEAKDDLGGQFEGIGAQLGVKDKRIVIVAPLKSSPAEAAGLRPGDFIVKVDGKETASWTLPEAVSKIRGPKGSKVILSIFREEASKSADITVLRDAINVPSVELDIQAVRCDGKGSGCIKEIACASCSKVAYLKLGRFGDQTSAEWEKAVDEIVRIRQENGTDFKGVILDLRNNPGGYLTGSVFIASEFLPDGRIVIQQNGDGTRMEYKVDREGRLTKIPLVVLINKGSASASEIVAGALKVRGRASLVGETSFGKGSIQEAIDLSGGAGIHITTAKWLLPDGTWINGTGITPDKTITLNPDKPDDDIQLKGAYEGLMR